MAEELVESLVIRVGVEGAVEVDKLSVDLHKVGVEAEGAGSKGAAGAAGLAALSSATEALATSMRGVTGVTDAFAANLAKLGEGAFASMMATFSAAAEGLAGSMRGVTEVANKLAVDLGKVGVVAQDSGAKGAAAMTALADTAKVVTDAMRGAADATAAEGKEILDVLPPFDRLRNMVETLGDRYDKTGQIGIRQITALSLTIKALEKAHDGAAFSAERLSVAERKIYDSAKASLADAIKKQREFNDEQQKIARATRDYTNLQGSLISLGGTLGNITKIAGGVVLAFTEGWRIGRQFDAFLTENISTWREWKEVSTDALRGANAELINNLNLTQRTRDLLPEIIARQNRARLGQGGIGAEAGLRIMEDVQREIQRGIDRGLVEGARTGAPKAARIIADALRQIPGLAYQGPQSLADVLGGMDRIPLAGERQLADLRKFQEEWFAGWDEFVNESSEQMSQVTESIMADYRAAWKAISDEAAKDFAETFGQPMTDIFTDLAMTGGRNFGQIAGKALQDTLERGASALTAIIGDAILGAFGAQEAPVEGETPEQTTARVQRNAQRSDRIGASIQGTIAGIGSIRANQRGQVNDTQTILNQIGVGASIGSAFNIGLGTAIGAVVGAIIGIISAVASSSADTDQYANFGFRDGQAFFEPGGGGTTGGRGNLNAADVQQALQQMRETMDTFLNGYIQIFMRFPGDFSDGMMIAVRNAGNILPQLGLDAGGDIGRGGSANFLKHFNEWVSGELPRDIAEMFFEPLSVAFQQYGMGAGRFRQIWDDLQGLDPKKAMELLGVLATAIVDFFETTAYFRTGVFQPMGPGDFAPSAAPLGLLEQARIRSHESFADALAREDEEIIRLGSTLSLLTGEEQIRTAGRLGQMMRDRQEAEMAFFARLAQSIENVGNQLDQFLLDIDLEQMVTPEGEPDYQARINRLQTEGERIWNNLMQAASPEAVEHWSSEWERVNREILGLAQSLGPEAYQEHLAWIRENTVLFQADVGAMFNQLGTAIETRNDLFLTGLGTTLDVFLNGLAEIIGGGDETPGPPGDRPVPQPQPIDPGQWASIESANSYLGEISGYDAQILAELVAIRSQGGAEPKVQTVRVGGVLRVEDSEGKYIDDVRLRRIQ